ncbi:MAG: SRPBCC family protein [Halobacteriales archaeon]
MDDLEISTVVGVPPERAYEFLVAFPNYAKYTDYLTEVRRHGDGGPGTRYDLVLSWWLVKYTAQSRVTDIEPPWRIDWELEDAIDAAGAWHVEPVDAEGLADHLDDVDGELPAADGAGSDGADGGSAPGSRIRLRARLDGESLGDAALGLPTFVPTSRVLRKVAPVAKREAKAVIGRIVADLEGRRRDVSLTVHSRPDFS